MKCSKCGFENDSDALFCEKCGASLSNKRVNNVSWIRRNWSWMCVFAGLLLLLVSMILNDERFFRYNLGESCHVFFFDNSCWGILLIGSFVWLSKILCTKQSIARWIIWLLFGIGVFFLFNIVNIYKQIHYGPNGEMITQGGGVLGPHILVIILWAYSIKKENSYKIC
ncbi:MAG: zinc ribbon domain-containing protein [Prevotella sp.]|nr:zinc ribbon domain-containing protein [Prevotella sp.]